MKKTLLLSSSLSSKSINFELLKLVNKLIPEGEERELVSVRDYELPLYNVDIEKEPGIADNAQKFMQLAEGSDRLIMAIAEHNGSVTAAFKNLLDWLSRLNKDYRFLADKEILLVGTSPSPYGAINALKHAKFLMECLGGVVKEIVAFPSYFNNFSQADTETVLTNQELEAGLISALNNFYSEEAIEEVV